VEKGMKEKRRQLFSAAVPWGRNLEAEVGPEVDLQIVARSVQEIDLVADIEAYAEMPPESLNADSRIEGEAGVPVRDTGHLIREPTAQRSEILVVAGSEVHEPYLAGNKEIGRAAAELEPRSEQTGERAQFCGGE